MSFGSLVVWIYCMTNEHLDLLCPRRSCIFNRRLLFMIMPAVWLSFPWDNFIKYLFIRIGMFSLLGQQQCRALPSHSIQSPQEYV